MVLSPSLGNAGRRGSHFVSGGGQKVAVVSRHTRACPLVPPTCPLFGFSPLSVSPKRDGRRRVPLYRAAILLLQSRTRQTPPPRICDFPTSGNSTTFPLIPAAPSGHVVGAEMLSPISCLLFPAPAAYDTATTIAVFSSDSLPPPTATIPPVSPRRAILSLRFTRDLSAFINYIATERCVSLLPVCLAAATAIV